MLSILILVLGAIVVNFVLGFKFMESRILDRDAEFFKSLKKFFKEITSFDILKLILFTPAIIFYTLVASIAIPMLVGVAYIVVWSSEIKTFINKKYING